MKKRYVLGFALCILFSQFLLGEEQPPAEPSKEPPKVMGLQFGMTDDWVQAEFTTNLSEQIDEKDDMVVWTGSLLQIDRPLKTYVYFRVTPPKDEESWPIKEVNKIVTVFDTSVYDATASDLLKRHRDLKVALTRKYKEPFSEKEFIDPLFDNSELRRTGFQTGNAEFSTIWKTTELVITLQLKGEVPAGGKMRVEGMTKEELTKRLSGKDEKTIKEGVIIFALTYEYLPLRSKKEKANYEGL